MTQNASTIKPDAPVLDANAVLAWYDRRARDLPWRVGPLDRARGRRPDPYRVWLSEIMLQQTTVTTVARYYARFVERWPTVSGLAAADRETVLAEWAGLGYYARARNLHACARRIVEEHDGRFPQTAAELAVLPGIGPYTSAAIAAICFDEPIAVVDGNVERVAARVMALERPPQDAKSDIRAFVQEVVPPRAGDFAQALMDIGSLVCTSKTAKCDACPFSGRCLARQSGNPLRYPVPGQRKVRPKRQGHAFVIERPDGAVWLRRRPESGMLAAMTAVPDSQWSSAALQAEFPIESEWRAAGRVKHVFTHFELGLDVWHAVAETPAGGAGWWSIPDNLPHEALPTLYRKVLKQAGVTIGPRA